MSPGPGSSWDDNLDDEYNPFDLDAWYRRMEKEEKIKSMSTLNDFKESLIARVSHTPDWPDLIRQNKGGYIPLFVYGSLKPMCENHDRIRDVGFCLGNSYTIKSAFRLHKSVVKKVGIAYLTSNEDKVPDFRRNDGLPLGGYSYMIPVHKILEYDKLFLNGHMFNREQITVSGRPQAGMICSTYRAHIYMPNLDYWKGYQTSDICQTSQVYGHKVAYYTKS